jgi:preprotein translocase subunit SecD
MPQGWRWKTILSAGFILFSFYFLVPTFFEFSNLSWLQKLFPEEKIKLGLDLQGGLYVEMEVVQEDAVRHRSDLIATDLQRSLEKESYAPAAVERVPDNSRIRLVLKKPEDLGGIRDWLSRNYRQALTEADWNEQDKTVLLDLQGDFASEIKDQSVRQALETIRHRIDRYGVSEPSIVRLGTNRISIELPGMADSERALNLIKKAGQLEFKLVDESMPDAAIRQLVVEAQNTLSLKEDYTEEAVHKINEQLIKKIPEGDEILFEVQYDPVTKKIVGGIPYLLKAKAEVTGDMLKNAQVNVQNNEPYVSLSLNSLGTKLFGDLTKANVGKRLAIVLDGNVSKAPVIKSEIPSGEAQITLGFGDYGSLLAEAEDLMLVLREGALPARLKELTKTVVGPSLGRDSIEIGVRTTLIAALLVVLFMAFYYRLSGVLADLALVVNILLILGALAIFQATLTLPGIAGIVLTMGMAVDANVLVFERMREELRDGKSARSAMTAGYQNALSAILDSNITTFLAGIVLYQFGSGPIRGFAVTLMIGILTTLFTALILTRLFQDALLYGLRREKLSV